MGGAVTVEPAGEPGQPDWRRKRDLAWLKDYRVVALSLGSAAAAFLLAFLLFIQPWHLKPAIGDLATWMTVVVGGAAAGFVLAQLRQQQRAIDEDRKRGRKRDELLDGQLRELADRERQRQREQAEGVKLADPGSAEINIINNSRRPVTRVAPRVVYDDIMVQASQFSIKERWADGDGVEHVGLYPPDKGTFDPASGEYRSLLADTESQAGFTIPRELADQPGTFVVRFNDDEGRRWELNQNMHLARAPNDSW
jgi:hypothetical protein